MWHEFEFLIPNVLCWIEIWALERMKVSVMFPEPAACKKKKEKKIDYGYQGMDVHGQQQCLGFCGAQIMLHLH